MRLGILLLFLGLSATTQAPGATLPAQLSPDERAAYDDAMLKLVNGARPGDTLVGRAEKIRELGAKAGKRLPQRSAKIQKMMRKMLLKELGRLLRVNLSRPLLQMKNEGSQELLFSTCKMLGLFC